MRAMYAPPVAPDDDTSRSTFGTNLNVYSEQLESGERWVVDDSDGHFGFCLIGIIKIILGPR